MNFNPFKRQSVAAKHVRSETDLKLLRTVQEFLQFGGGSTGSTRKFVNSYESNALVYMVVNRISTTSAAIRRIAVNAKGEEIQNSKILALLANPNKFQGYEDFMEKTNEQLLLAGNAFLLHIAGIGAGNELEVLESANMEIIVDRSGNIIGYEYTNNIGARIKYDLDEILHIKMSNSSKEGREWRFWGIAPLSALWSTVDSSNDLFTALRSLWKNRGIIGFLTNKSDRPLLEAERLKLQATLDNNAGGAEKANKVAATTGNVDFVQLGMSPADLKLLEGNVSNLRIISAGYKMNSVLFNDVAGTTFNNLGEAKIESYTDVYIPLAEKINNAISKWLSPRLKVEETIKLDISSVEVLKTTTNPVANKLNNLPPTVAARVLEVMTGDEAREIVGLDSITGGEVLLGKSNNSKDGKEDTK